MSKQKNNQKIKRYNEKQLREMESQTNLSALDAMSDKAIDYSDNPETDTAFWANAEIVPPGNKVPISMRIDADVLHWYKSKGGRYQKLMHEVLKRYMYQHN